jgi:glutamyl-tRNA reductase
MIGVLGISHNTASLDVREKFALSQNMVSQLGELILQNTEVTETVILSTCNRTEIYYYHKKACIKKTDKQLKDLLHQFKDAETDYTQYFYSHSNYDAVSHLFSVVSGVDSMLIGEDQIVNQVKEAYLLCTNLALTDAVLMRLFQKSFETGKKARTETNIQKGATSISFVAVDKCLKMLDSNVANKKVLIVGTGETSQLVVEKMIKQGISKFIFANRTLETAQKFASEYNGFAIEFSDFKRYISDSDLIITATEAGHLLINKDDIDNSHKQIFIDLSVPRNIDMNITEHKNIHLISIDDLQEDLASNTLIRKESKRDAEVIIDQMTNEFFTWLENRALRPVIKSITENMQKIHLAEIENSKQCYTPETYKAIDEYASRLTQKYIRTLIKKLKEINENGNAAHSLKTINDLFEFDTNTDTDFS